MSRGAGTGQQLPVPKYGNQPGRRRRKRIQSAVRLQDPAADARRRAASSTPSRARAGRRAAPPQRSKARDTSMGPWWLATDVPGSCGRGYVDKPCTHRLPDAVTLDRVLAAAHRSHPGFPQFSLSTQRKRLLPVTHESWAAAFCGMSAENQGRRLGVSPCRAGPARARCRRRPAGPRGCPSPAGRGGRRRGPGSRRPRSRGHRRRRPVQ